MASTGLTPTRSKFLKLTAVIAAGASLCSCGASSASSAQAASPASRTKVEVVAAENFWGSIAAQLGGARVHVTSIITDPNVDPHSYEPTPSDARKMAIAQLVIVNGVGYDPWADKLLSADTDRRTDLNVGRVLGLKQGDNPHRWYNPTDVQAIVAAITTRYSAIDPSDRPYFQAQEATFKGIALEQYNSLIDQIRAGYSGTPIGASESIFSMMAPVLGLTVVTPYSFLRAISEGTDVSPADKATIDRQIRSHSIKIYVYNTQNSTPDVEAQLRECRTEGIPTATITETLTPASSTFQEWQARQLQGILSALQKASGR
jgi:zinc/manganese transport system substrate-binding protein